MDISFWKVPQNVQEATQYNFTDIQKRKFLSSDLGIPAQKKWGVNDDKNIHYWKNLIILKINCLS